MALDKIILISFPFIVLINFKINFQSLIFNLNFKTHSLIIIMKVLILKNLIYMIANKYKIK